MDRDVVLDFRRKLLHSFYFFTFVMVAGTAGYRLIGGDNYSLLDCFYMTIITVATVGYGEIIDLSSNPGGRVFTIVLIFSGMSVILYFMSNVTAFLIEGHIKEIFWRRKMQKLINGLKGHYIICGVGRLGFHIAQELSHTKRPAVLVEIDHSRVEALKDKFSEMAMLAGDATDQDTLIEAGIGRAG